MALRVSSAYCRGRAASPPGLRAGALMVEAECDSIASISIRAARPRIDADDNPIACSHALFPPKHFNGDVQRRFVSGAGTPRSKSEARRLLGERAGSREVANHFA
jgi:hypothetical protein